MSPDIAVPEVADSRFGVDTDAARRADVARSGAERVELSERFYLGIFFGILIFSGVAALSALVLLPLHQPAGSGGPPLSGLVGAGLLVVATPAALWRAPDLYRALRRHPRFELGFVVYAAALVTGVYPLHSQLWWPSCALLMLVAVVAPLRRVLGYCLLVLSANLLAHALVGDLGTTPPVSIIGLWVGYIFWSTTVGAFSDQLAAHLLRLNAEPARPLAPLRVQAWTTPDRAKPADMPADGRTEEQTHDAEDLPPLVDGKGEAYTARLAFPEPVAGREIDRLTARQLQVVALLADGLGYADVAACLSISPGQVQRHVARAVGRLGARNANELVALAVNEGLAPTTELVGPEACDIGRSAPELRSAS